MRIPELFGIEIVAGEQSWKFKSPFPDEFCRIGDIGSNGILSVELKATLGSNLIPIHVDGGKNVGRIRVKRNGELSVRMGLRREGGTIFTVYPENHMRFLSIATERIAIWEAAVISQQGTFFLTFQETVNISLKEGIGGVLYGVGPQLQNWPQMRKFLENLLGKQLLMMPEDHPQEVRAWRVIWYNLAQGIGAIKTNQGVARVHWSQVAPRKNGFRYLQKGERGECKVVPMVKKPGARPTTFEWEAKNVIPR